MEKTLERICDEHGTDKLSHGFCKHYAERFEPIRFNPITICEIGTWEGASVKSWLEYFGNPLTKVVGFDHRPDWMPEEGCQIIVEIGSQEDAEFQDGFGKRHGPFDIIVDDGGHKPLQHLASIDALWPYLKPGGWYAIEDMHSIFNICWNESGEDRTIFDWLNERWKSILVGGSEVQRVDVVGGDWDDGIIFLQKRSEPYTPEPKP